MNKGGFDLDFFFYCLTNWLLALGLLQQIWKVLLWFCVHLFGKLKTIDYWLWVCCVVNWEVLAWFCHLANQDGSTLVLYDVV
jgi:hypothetical protein